MKHLLRVLLVGFCILLLAGCTCRKKPTLPPGQDNIPLAEAGSLLKDIYFEFDSYSIDAESRKTINQSAEWLKANADKKVTIEGHCDERGTNEYNMVLGANRARAVYDYLRTLGVEVSRLKTVSYGEELPLDPRHNEEAWAKNRRAHFDIQ